MIRKAFIMSVHPDCVPEYIQRHQPIWEELAAVLRAHGGHNYSIFHDPATHQLFGYVEIEDEARWAAVAQTEVCQRWWQSMKHLMPCDPTGRPIGRDINEVFHLA